LAHSWPGNVRELEHTIERAVVVSEGPWLDLDPLSEDFGAGMASDAVPTQASAETLDAVQREHILRALSNSGNRIAGPNGAAQRLGLHPNTLRHRIRKLGLRGD
jgi:formate hydrogenlyase transcriptional activator